MQRYSSTTITRVTWSGSYGVRRRDPDKETELSFMVSRVPVSRCPIRIYLSLLGDIQWSNRFCPGAGFGVGSEHMQAEVVSAGGRLRVSLMIIKRLVTKKTSPR